MKNLDFIILTGDLEQGVAYLLGLQWEEISACCDKDNCGALVLGIYSQEFWQISEDMIEDSIIQIENSPSPDYVVRKVASFIQEHEINNAPVTYKTIS